MTVQGDTPSEGRSHWGNPHASAFAVSAYKLTLEKAERVRVDTGILIGIVGVVATIFFGIVGPLVIRNRHSRRQKVTGAHSTAMQSSHDNIIIDGPATFNSQIPDAHSDELRIAIGATIFLGMISSFYIWDKTHPIELQQTILLNIAFPFIIALLVIVPTLWLLVFIKRVTEDTS